MPEKQFDQCSLKNTMNDAVKLHRQYPSGIRLAVILPSLAGGGLEKVQLSLIREWVKQGIEVDLVVSRLQGPLISMIPAEASTFEVAGNHPYFFPFGLYRYLKTRKPTHILSSANDVNAIVLTLARLLRLDVPIVASVHAHLSSELRVAKGIERLTLWAVIWLLKHLIRRAKGMVAVSQGVAEDLMCHFPLQPGQLNVIYNPVISPQTYHRMTFPLENCPVPQSKPWVLFVGRLVEAKGIDVLLNAFQFIAQDTDAHLVLVGVGPLQENIVEQIAAIGLASRIHLVGFQENPLPWMREAHLVVLPSRHEGLGNVLIEAMACGTQVVATDCPGGVTEILDNGKFGQLVPVENSEELAKALLRSLKNEFWIDPKLLVKRAELFTVCRAAEKYLSLLVVSE